MLIDMAEAMLHVRARVDWDEEDVSNKLAQAESLVLDRCNSTAYWRDITVTWTSATVPASIKAAILIVLTHLFENRGDDMRVDEAVWLTVDRLIFAYRDPALA